MQRQICTFIILVAALCVQGSMLWAQKIKTVKPILPKVELKISPAVKRTIAYTVFKQPDVRLSVARLDHALSLKTPMNRRPHTTAFLFETTYKGRPEIWAITAGHNAQEKEPLLLTFFDGKKSIPVRGTLVQQGPALLSDMGLIKLKDPLPAQLRPLKLADVTQWQGPLTTWGYASNKLYHVDNLTVEKDNKRFLHTNFPAAQHKRAGLCGGPLLNASGEVLGVHCGTSLENKSYAASVRIIPYLLQAYHEGIAEVPVIIKDHVIGNIHINERIFQIYCLDERGKVLEIHEVYEQLHQSEILQLLQNPEVHALQFVLGSHLNDYPQYGSLIYDKKTKTSRIEEGLPTY